MKAVLFDLDDTLLNTRKLEEYRTRSDRSMLTNGALDSIKLFKGVEGVLNKIKEKNIPMGIVTNSPRWYADAVLEKLGVKDYFQVFVYYDDVAILGRSKPDPYGIELAIKQLNVDASYVYYVGDSYTDCIAAYRAGVTPLMPTWGVKNNISVPPALAVNSLDIIDILDDENESGEFQLYAERAAQLKRNFIPKKFFYYLPLALNGDVVQTVKDTRIVALGRYFSKTSNSTAILGARHELSKEISKKDSKEVFDVPDYWVSMFVNFLSRAYKDRKFFEGGGFHVLTTLPAKKGGDKRMERLLASIGDALHKMGIAVDIADDIFEFVEGARKIRTLGAQDRRVEIENSLHISDSAIGKYSLLDKHVIIIDDVITTGSTLNRAFDLLVDFGAKTVNALVLAKTVSFAGDEKPCKNCDGLLAYRVNRTNGVPFYSCYSNVNSDPSKRCGYSESYHKCPRCGGDTWVMKNGLQIACKNYPHTCSGYIARISDLNE